MHEPNNTTSSIVCAESMHCAYHHYALGLLNPSVVPNLRHRRSICKKQRNTLFITPMKISSNFVQLELTVQLNLFGHISTSAFSRFPLLKLLPLNYITLHAHLRCRQSVGTTQNKQENHQLSHSSINRCSSMSFQKHSQYTQCRHTLGKMPAGGFPPRSSVSLNSTQIIR